MLPEIAKVSALAVVLGLQAGCASSRTVPMKVQSDPLGAYVVMKIKGGEKAESDWIYLGNTPVTTQRRFSKTDFESDHVIVLRVMKDGYVEQMKEWRGNEFERTVKKDGQLFWNPKLVDVN